MRLLPLTADDVPACMALFVASIGTLGRRHYSAEQCAAWAAPGEEEERLDGWRRRLDSAWGLKALGEDGAMLGFAWLCHDGEFDMLFTDPAAAGRGVAGALVAALEARAGQAGLVRLHAWASHGSRPVFERAGWRVLRANRVERAGVVLDNWLMEKHLEEGAA